MTRMSAQRTTKRGPQVDEPADLAQLGAAEVLAAGEEDRKGDATKVRSRSTASSTSLHTDLQPYPFEMLDATAEPEPKLWVVEGLIGQREIVGLVGLPFVGKSLTAGTMALSVASSRDFLGQAVRTAGAVVYLAGERGAVTKVITQGVSGRRGLVAAGSSGLPPLPERGLADSLSG